MKKDPVFSKNVGMVLVHNGIVRGWFRDDRKPVASLEVQADIEALNFDHSFVIKYAIFVIG